MRKTFREGGRPNVSLLGVANSAGVFEGGDDGSAKLKRKLNTSPRSGELSFPTAIVDAGIHTCFRFP